MELTQNPSYTETTSLLKSRTWFDWLFLAVLAAGALFALNRYGDFMDIYEKGILLAAVLVLAASALTDAIDRCIVTVDDCSVRRQSRDGAIAFLAQIFVL